MKKTIITALTLFSVGYFFGAGTKAGSRAIDFVMERYCRGVDKVIDQIHKTES